MLPHMPTVQQYNVTPCEAVVHPGRPVLSEKELVKKAARHARLVFPGAIGEYLGIELDSWAAMSLRYDDKGVTRRLMDALFAIPEPPKPKAK